MVSCLLLTAASLPLRVVTPDRRKLSAKPSWRPQAVKEKGVFFEGLLLLVAGLLRDMT